MRLAAAIGLAVLGLLGLVGYRLATMDEGYDPYSAEAVAERAAEDSLSARAYRTIAAAMDSARAAGGDGDALGTYTICGERCTESPPGMELVLMPEAPGFEGVYAGFAPANACLGSLRMRWSQGSDGVVTLEYPMGIDTGTAVEFVVTADGLYGGVTNWGFDGWSGSVHSDHRRFVATRSGPPSPTACGRSASSEATP